MTDYFCPILHRCPHWLEKCYANGCQHPEAIEIGNEEMTWGNPPKFVPTKPKQGKKITPEDLAKSGTEDGHQMALFAQAAENVGKYPQLKWLHSIPNGGHRHAAEASKLVATGTRGGVWDVFLPCPVRQPWHVDGPDGAYHGLYIEMKKSERRNHKDGGLSKEQLEFGTYAKQMGYYCAVCYTWQEAWEILVKYMEVKI